MENEMVTIMLTAIGGLCTICCGLVAWIGNRIYHRMDEIGDNLLVYERETKDIMHDMDKRVTRLEDHVFPEAK